MYPENFAEDIVAELSDVDYENMQHGKRHTYIKGCTGPLCLRADREWRRERYAARRLREGKQYNPEPELRRTLREEELQAAYDWHKQQCAQRAYDKIMAS